MANTKINYTKPARTAAPAPGPVVLKAGESVFLTGPRAGQVSAAPAPKIDYRKR